MSLLDTNVVLALMRSQPERSVIGWLDQQIPEQIWLPSVVVFEVRYGLALLEPGSRRTGLEQGFERMLSEFIQERIAPLNALAAEQAALLAATRKRVGTPVDLRDTLIAGIAMATGATIATRNLKHFQDLPIPVLNPFSRTTP